MIYIECKPDSALLKAIIPISKRDIDHEFKGKGAICNRLRKDSHSKALIDEDPQSPQPAYLGEAKIVEELSEQGLKLLEHPAHNRLILLCPRLEEWVIKAAQEAGLDLRNYKLPNDGARLHSIINVNLDKFENLLKDLKGSNRLRMLKKLIEQ